MSENFEKCIVCHEDLETSKLNKCTSCTAHYCNCCLVSLMMSSLKKEDSTINCCYCSKKMQIKFNNGIELPINISQVEIIELPYFGPVTFSDNRVYAYPDSETRYLNTEIFMNDNHPFFFHNQLIRVHLSHRNQSFDCHIKRTRNGNHELTMYSEHDIYFHNIDAKLETRVDTCLHSRLYFNYNQEHNRWDFVREHTDVSRRKMCMMCKGSVARNYEFHVANSKVHKKFLEEKAKAQASVEDA